MAAEDCIAEIRKVAADLTDDEITEIVERLDRVRRSRAAGRGLDSLDEELLTEADAIAEGAITAARIEKRNRMINIRVFNEMMTFAETADELTGQPARALLARNVGSNVKFPGARSSVDSRGNALFQQYMGGMLADLKRENVLVQLNGRVHDLDIARELAELSKRQGRPGISKNADALKIARIVDKYRRAWVARENRAGAWIQPLDGYIVRQSHDMHRIRRAGLEEWKASIIGELDQEKTFQGADPNEFLNAAYEGITTGIHIRSRGATESDLPVAFKGPGNLAKRISEHRVLHFRDADAWFRYNQRFGRGTVMEAVFHEAERAARNTALMESWGTNPRAMFDRVMRELQEKHRGEPDKLARLTGRHARALENQFKEVDGTTRIPVGTTSANVTAAVLAVETLSKLGGAALSAFGDLGFKAAAVAEAGPNMLRAWSDVLTSSLEELVPAQRRIAADLINVGIEGQIGDVAARFSAQDDIPGTLSRAQRIFFKLNLLGPWTDAHKRGLGRVFSRHLAMESVKDWGGLDPQLRVLLENYEIDEPAWRVIRQAAREEADGNVYVTTDSVRDVPDEAMRAVYGDISARALRGRRDRLETALQSYYADRAEFGVPTPGARERAILRQGTQPGEPLGIAVRLVAQFKAFPTTVITKVIGRMARADTMAEFARNMISGRADMVGLVHLMIATTALGYVAQSAKQLAKGRTPRDPTDPETWTAAMLQGGGLGIYGDFLFGEYTRFGRSFTETLAGPTFGTISEAAALLATIREGRDPSARGVRFAIGHAPFLNLFYTRVALDYLFIYQLQEAVNPGYLRRMERLIERENKQRYLVPPSQVIPIGGGSRLLEGVR